MTNFSKSTRVELNGFKVQKSNKRDITDARLIGTLSTLTKVKLSFPEFSYVSTSCNAL